MDNISETFIVPTVRVSHGIDMQNELELHAAYQPADTCLRIVADARRRPRFKLQIDITISSRTCGVLKGHTVDISESGVAALLPIEAPLGEIVELSFALSHGLVRIHAIVRQRNAFRYGFEFVDQELVHEFIRRTCRDLAFG
jgi:hypothetical protein